MHLVNVIHHNVGRIQTEKHEYRISNRKKTIIRLLTETINKNTRYLGVYIVNSKSFKCSINASKRAISTLLTPYLVR